MAVTETPNEVLARRLRAVRGDESQESFAHRAGVSVATISRIERGRFAPRWGTALRLSVATGKSVSFFLGEDDAEEGEADLLERLIAVLLETKARKSNRVQEAV